MNIGFDAKRAYHNGTGLGHYSRTLIGLLSQYYPEHQYYLFNPKASSQFTIPGKNIHEVLPSSPLHKIFNAGWRSSWVKSDLKKYKIDVYHGVSHEIPRGIQNIGVKSVVTIHDLIFERFPEQYKKADVAIYRNKFRYACKYADRVVAISQQTKKDIIEFYKTPEEKISICYQSCHPAFAQEVSVEVKAAVKLQYNLPEEFFLYVGSIIERKNLLNICKAMFLLRNEIQIPLVVIGDGGRYKKIVKDYIFQNGLQDKIIFLSDNAAVQLDKGFQTAEKFAAIYQSAIAMIYPSFFEGFGAPVLEALWSKLPVITSNVSCLPEAGGPGSYYVDPNSAEEIANGMKKIYTDYEFAAAMRQNGFKHAITFSPDVYAANMMNIYKMVW